MRAVQIFVMLVVSGIALAFALMPVLWCEVPHRRDLGALMAFLVLVAYLVMVDFGNASVSKLSHVLIGSLCGIAIASIIASGPVGFALGVCAGAALGKFGLDWAA